MLHVRFKLAVLTHPAVGDESEHPHKAGTHSSYRAHGAAQQRPHRVQELVQRGARARVVVSQQPARDVREALLWRNPTFVSSMHPVQTNGRASSVLLWDV